MVKTYPCEKCKRMLTSGVLYDLVEMDFKYHRYCKDCIRKAVKELAEKFPPEQQKFILFDYPKNDRGLKDILEVTALNIQNLIFEKIRTDPEFAKYYNQEMAKLMPEMFGDDKILSNRVNEISENGN